MEWVLQLPVLFFSVVVHEFCHGVAAYERGDDTAERAGRLTLNPLPHIDAFGTIFLPLLCLFSSVPVFAWAKPVPVDPSRMKDPRRDTVQVAAVGPLANIVLALSCAVMYKLVRSTAFFTPQVQGSALDLLLFGVTINLFLAFFNLLPIHPLDGSKVLAGLLPARARAAYLRHVPYGMIILMVLLFTHGINTFVVLPLKLVLALWVKLGIIG